MSNFGTKNLKSFLGVFIKAGMVIEPVLEDGKITLMEGLSSGAQLSGEFMAILNIDYSLLIKEWIDLNDEEMKDLDQFVRDNLQLANVDTELFIEQAFSIAIALSSEIKKALSLFKGLKNGENS